MPDQQNFTRKPDHIARNDLLALAPFNLAIYLNQSFGDRRLGLATTAHQRLKLQDFKQLDRFGNDLYDSHKREL